MTYIYKICPADIWEKAEKDGVFSGAGIDLIDGFIHFSTQTQTAETLRLHFAGVSDLKLVRIDADTLDIVWEESRGGQLFPHLYGSIPISKVIAVYDLPLGNDGVHILPDLPLD
jgi:uncharacterized protein (DUF952 family)